MNSDLRQLIFAAVDGTISPADFARLQNALEHDEQLRSEYLRAIALSETLSELARSENGDTVSSESPNMSTGQPTDVPDSELATPASRSDFEQTSTSLAADKLGYWSVAKLTVALTALLLVGAFAFWLGRQNGKPGTSVVNQSSPQQNEEQGDDAQPGDAAEAKIAGHATLRRSVDVRWAEDIKPRREGDVLPNGPLAFVAGVMEIDLFCGATLIVEGPARLNIESDWIVQVHAGRLRAIVPPAARGFVVKAADAEIVDLGTEFALHVGADTASVQVIDGEVKLRGGQHNGKHLLTGEGQALKGKSEQKAAFAGLSTVADLQMRRRHATAKRFTAWQKTAGNLQSDRRLIAYFPLAVVTNDRRVRNTSAAGQRFDGLLVGAVDRVPGRFGPLSGGLNFDRPGARVRTRIDGQFSAFTFVCWVKIDSLEHRYNALFLADSYENGEPHWQIRDDGRLMFSVMVDDTQVIRHFSKRDNRFVDHAGLHHVYYSKPFWDISKSGQWFQLAAVYDPVGRSVKQYVNGEEISSEPISDTYHITQLRIGAAEIGNWGQPFRKTPWFAVRNLNGTIDELAIFDAALNVVEIKQLYEQGKPLGY